MPERTEKAKILVQHKELIVIPAAKLTEEIDAYTTATRRLGFDAFEMPDWIAGCQCGWKSDESQLYSDAYLAWAEHAIKAVDASLGVPGVV